MLADSIGETVKLLLSITDKLMDRMPTYNQRKKETYHKLRMKYLEEKSKAYPERDDNLVGLCRMELLEFIRTFEQEIEAKQ